MPKKIMYKLYSDDELIFEARKVAEKRLESFSETFTNPSKARQYLVDILQNEKHEVFGALFLTNQHGLISYKKLFFGSISGCSVYTRVVASEALRLNAAAVILFHNHPSGSLEPSESDKSITKRIVEALSLIDVTVLDHIIVGINNSTSMASMGLV